MDYLLEELFLRTLDVWNGNCKMKRNVIFLGWSSWDFISMKKNVEFKNDFQINNNWTRRCRLFYNMECFKLSMEGNLWC
jgi:hypothetical protein